MSREDERLKAALKRYKEAKLHYNELAEKHKVLARQVMLGEYYSVSGLRIDMPFVPSTANKVETMMELIGTLRGKKAADLGCGDGKIVFEMAKRGATVDGYELEPRLAGQARGRLSEASLSARVIEQNFFTADLSKYDVITIYGITSVMKRLEIKLRQEMKLGSVLVSNTFTLPNWRPERTKNDVYLYRKVENTEEV